MSRGIHGEGSTTPQNMYKFPGQKLVRLGHTGANQFWAGGEVLKLPIQKLSVEFVRLVKPQNNTADLDGGCACQVCAASPSAEKGISGLRRAGRKKEPRCKLEPWRGGRNQT